MVKCCVPGCEVKRNDKWKGTSIFKIPKRKNEQYSKWRKNLMDIISLNRKLEPSFIKEVLNCNIDLFICEKHFDEKSWYYTPGGIKYLDDDALPNPALLPPKSHVTVKKERKPPKIRVVTEPEDTEQSTTSAAITTKKYSDLNELLQDFNEKNVHSGEAPYRTQIKWYSSFTSQGELRLYLTIEPQLVSYLEILIDSNFMFSVFVYGWLLPKNHALSKIDLQNTPIVDFLSELISLKLCPGLDSSPEVCGVSKVISHVVPSRVEYKNNPRTPFNTQVYNRSVQCKVLGDSDSSMCGNCLKVLNKVSTEPVKPLHPNTPLSSVKDKTRLVQSVKDLRKENIKLKKRLKQEIESKSVTIDSTLAKDLDTIMSQNEGNISPFMKVFWEEQKKLSGVKSDKGLRYHPMIIRFCLSLHSKSSSSYEELRSSGVLKLPSSRTLRDYKNAIKPQAGFNPAVIDQLKTMVKDYRGYERNVLLSFDEMKIQGQLVFAKYSGELVGYIDLGDPDLNFMSLEDANELATHALVFYVTGLTSKLKFELSYMGTKNLLSYQLISMYWKAVGVLEVTCKLRVMATTCDGAATNRAFFKMHRPLSYLDESSVVYRTINLYDKTRYIWFFSDTPHLMKTARNCLYSSGSGPGKTRNMCNDGLLIVWDHIVYAYQQQQNMGLKLMNKLKEEHVYLNSYSKMNVRLATQVLSSTVANYFETYTSPVYHGTAKYCEMFDKFFDIFNGKSTLQFKVDNKPFLKPFSDVNDSRISWLMETFLPYFENWQSSIHQRSDLTTLSEKQKLFISPQTYLGVLMNVHSLIGLSRYLLRQKNDHTYDHLNDDIQDFILTGKISQDATEENFGRHRSAGRRNENPTLQQFGYDSNMIRLSRSIMPATGNTEGAHRNVKSQRSWYDSDDTPVAKRPSRPITKKTSEVSTLGDESSA